MKIITGLIFCLIAAGCGSGGGESVAEPPPNHGYGFEYDALGPDGMRVRFFTGHEDFPEPNTLADVLVLEALYRDVEACIGMAAFPPFVIFVRGGSLYQYGWRSVYFDTPPLVLLDSGDVDIARHEFIHHLLQMNTGDKDVNHISPFFKTLAAGGCV